MNVENLKMTYVDSYIVSSALTDIDTEKGNIAKQNDHHTGKNPEVPRDDHLLILSGQSKVHYGQLHWKDARWHPIRHGVEISNIGRTPHL